MVFKLSELEDDEEKTDLNSREKKWYETKRMIWKWN